MGFISVDLDTVSIRTLLKTIRNALDMGLKIRKVEISPSKRGFHLIIENSSNEIEGLMKRALLNDDARRIRYALKRLAMGGETEIVFERKAGMNSIDITDKIDFDEIREREVDELVEKYEKIIKPMQRRVWITCIGFSEEIKGNFEDICEDIAERDKSFKYRIYESYFPRYDFVLVIFSESKDQAMQRGEWFKRVFKRELGVDLLYWVKEKKEK